MKDTKNVVLKGINYDAGTDYDGHLSREILNEATVRKEIQVIKDVLHCNCVQIYGSDIGRLAMCAKEALVQGLFVWLQPRLINSTPRKMLDHLVQVAMIAERLRTQHQKIVLNAGCELSIFMSGILPGYGFSQRALSLALIWPFLPLFNRKLNRHLQKALATAKKHFDGQVSYSAGIWEDIDWRGFDFVGLNYYREASNQKTYVNDLRSFHRFNKPIVITEFGCCCYEGADMKGGSGDDIVDWSKLPPKLKKTYKRNEMVQADYVIDLLKIFDSENVYGAFVFEFIEPSYPYSPDALMDLDMASYGIVKRRSIDLNAKPDGDFWEPKLAFTEISKLYGDGA